MNKVIKVIFLLILILILILSFSSSYTSLNIDSLAFAVAMGIDVGDVNKLKVTFQFTNSASISENGTSDSDSNFINTVEASSIDNAINLMNAFLGKELNLSHCKLIVFSEEFAYTGIEKELYSLENNIQVRPSASIVVSKCDAKDYIQNSDPSLENLITQYYEVFPTSGRYTGYTYDSTLSNFMNGYVCGSCEAFAILGGLSSNTPTDSAIEAGNVKSGNTNISGKRGSENIGVAVFKDDVLVGELNANETICLCVIKNKVDGFLITIPNPKDNEKTIDVYIYPQDKPKVKVDISSGFPYISLSAKFDGSIYSMESDLDYLDAQNLYKISEATNKYLENMFKDYLYKTSKEFKSDINGFGRIGQKNFMTIDEMKNYDWLNVYENSFFDVKFNTSIESSGLLLKT